MRRPSSVIGLAVVFVLGVCAVLALNGCGDKNAPGTAAATTTATNPPIGTLPATTPAATTPAPPPVATTPKKAKTTASKPSAKAKTAKTPKTTTQATPPHLETSPQELAKRAKDAAEKAAKGGAKTCPDLSKPAEAKDITVLHISCKTATGVIFADQPGEKKGFVCDIVNESFSDVPAVEYSCNRKADKAKLGYTAVG